MLFQTEIQSLAYLLENRVFFCLAPMSANARRVAKDGKMKIVELPRFTGNLRNEAQVEKFLDETDVKWMEDDARVDNETVVLIGDLPTLQITYAWFRDWCVSNVDQAELQFNQNNLAPLIEVPRRR